MRFLCCQNCSHSSDEVNEEKLHLLNVRPSPQRSHEFMQDLVNKDNEPTDIVDIDCTMCGNTMTQISQVLTTPAYLMCVVTR